MYYLPALTVPLVLMMTMVLMITTMVMLLCRSRR